MRKTVESATHALSVADAFMLLAVGLMVGALLGHALRKTRSQDWVVALGWGLGGSVAIGTGLWLLQLLAWRQAQPGMATWFELAPFVLAWGAAVGGVAVALFVARWMPSHRVANPMLLLFLAPTLVVLFVVCGAALAQPPRWAQIAAGPVLGALGLALAGLALSLHLLNGPRRRWLHRAAGQRAAGAAVFALALLLAQGLGMSAVPMQPTLTPSDYSAMPADAVDARLAAVVLWFAAFVLLMAGLCALVDARSGRRAHVLAGSLQSANRRLRELAFRDALSGLPNRMQFEERLDETLALVGRRPNAMAVLFIDLDGFKAVNESFGHAAGDEVLREVGRRLHAIARGQDTAARAGGDEFLLLIADPGSPENAAATAQQALHSLVTPYRLPGGSEVRLSCSIGIAMFPEHGPTTRLIANADAAMFAVKRTGGATYAFFEPRMDLDATDQLELQNDLRLAIERDELALFYQPKVDARTREMTGVEALVRWHHPARGSVGPSELIAVAERFGLIGAIGHWVLEEACRQVRRWETQGLRIRVAINLSAHQLRQDDLVQRVRQSFVAHAVEPSLFTFEITESVAMEDTQATVRSFAQLARAGVSLAIDDFGTGHSSLAYLRTLPAQQLKIDRSFIGDLGLSGDAMAVVDAVIRLAHALGLRVVAEGVETERQCEILHTLGCDEYQGYLFARPMDAERVALWASGEATTRLFLGAEAPRAAVLPPEPPATLQ
jgi:diguanylate cyclase (GGDEF)-like protein